jgi:hypothetical protein
VTGFKVDVYQNEYLAAGSREVNAIVTVSAGGATPGGAGGPGGGGGGLGGGADAAEIILVDCSTSMDYPNSKLLSAKIATSAAIDMLRPGVYFAVIAGSDVAEVIYPVGRECLVPANPDSRSAAKRAVSMLYARGGTAIGRWLMLANRLFERHPAAIRHAILLTDGRDESESAIELGHALAACAGRFTVDCRGVGTDWAVDELRRIATALLGTVDIVAQPHDLAADFTAMMAHAMGKAVGDVTLRLWTPQGASVRFVKQVAPAVFDLTGRAVHAPVPRSRDYPTGSWGTESREYHVCVEVSPGTVGDEMLAARVSVVVGSEITAKGLVRAVWTDDDVLSTRISPEVAHYTGQAELAQTIQEGLQARKDGDVDTATSKLARALALANASGNEGTVKLLRKVVDVVDEVTGTVRLRSRVADADEMALDTRSTKTVRVRKR